MIRDRRISSGEVNRYIGEMGREITELEQRLQALRAASTGASSSSGAPRRRGRPPGRPAASASSSQPAAPRRRRRRSSGPVNPQVLASRKLQGKYLSLIRRIPANRRAHYSRIAKEKGRETAIRELQSVVK
ncbi:MAG: hypothetical protein ACXV5L_00940 [Thermoanaerobaculia bacterium]